MNKLLLSFVLLTVALSGATAAWAQAADTADHTAPSYDMKGQSLLDLQTVQTKMVALANAIPADKLTWRPTPDSRSFAEVFLHVAAERYQILAMGGPYLLRASTARRSRNQPPIKRKSSRI